MLQQINLCRDIMMIKRKNYVATMDFYVATLSNKFLKKNVATFLCYVATLIKENGSTGFSRHSKLCVTPKIWGSFDLPSTCRNTRGYRITRFHVVGSYVPGLQFLKRDNVPLVPEPDE